MSLCSETIQFVGFFDFPFYENENLILQKFKDYLVTNSKEYYYIVHDMDKDNNNAYKTIHCHFIYKKKNKTVVATELNNLTMYLFNDMKLRILITIDKLKSYEMSLRYLVHRDNAEKYQYKWDSIVSNVNFNMINAVLEPAPKRVITIEYLIELVKECHCDTWEIYKKLGIQDSMKYRGIIKDLIIR